MLPRKLNPFAGLPNPREVFAWGLYDLANQSFTLLIITLLFPIYFREVVVADAAKGESIWSAIGSASLLVVVVVSPLLGALADGYGLKKRLLVGTGYLCAALTVALTLTGEGDVWLAAGLFIVANVLYQIGENFLASFLPEVSTPRNVGRVSATGWTMGYLGALSLLVLVAAGMFGYQAITGEELALTDWWVFFAFAGVWFALGILTPSVVLKEASASDREAREHGPIRVAFERVADTLRHAAHYRQLIRFLTAFFVYGCGINVMVYFAGLLAQDFGFEQVELVIFVLQLSVTAGIAAACTAFIQDRLGARTTVLLYLSLWIVASLGLLAIALLGEDGRRPWMFWTVGNFIGFALGGAGAASRAFVGRFTPAHRTGEFFGLWGMTYKLSGVVGVLAFGQVKAFAGDIAANALLLAIFIAGLALLLRVSETAGLCAKRRAERAFAAARSASKANPRT